MASWPSFAWKALWKPICCVKGLEAERGSSLLLIDSVSLCNVLHSEVAKNSAWTICMSLNIVHLGGLLEQHLYVSIFEASCDSFRCIILFSAMGKSMYAYSTIRNISVPTAVPSPSVGEGSGGAEARLGATQKSTSS
jgi:hypothetical protein